MPSFKQLNVRRAAAYVMAIAYFAIAQPRPGTAWAGLGLAFAGEALRLWAAGHLVKNKELSRGGPYSHVRNPLYLGTLLIVIGFGIAGSAASVPAIYIPTVLLPASLVVFLSYYFPYKEGVETERLVRRFGAEAEAYIQSVPAFVPRLTRDPAGAGSRWSAAKVAQNHEHLVLLALGGAAALLLLKARLFSP